MEQKASKRPRKLPPTCYELFLNPSKYKRSDLHSEGIALDSKISAEEGETAYADDETREKRRESGTMSDDEKDFREQLRRYEQEKRRLEQQIKNEGNGFSQEHLQDGVGSDGRERRKEVEWREEGNFWNGEGQEIEEKGEWNKNAGIEWSYEERKKDFPNTNKYKSYAGDYILRRYYEGPFPGHQRYVLEINDTRYPFYHRFGSVGKGATSSASQWHKQKTNV